jgi:transcriptional regulator of acetoin/glycerol metabolism
MQQARSSHTVTASDARMKLISQARQTHLVERRRPSQALVSGWVDRSWERCLQIGLQPEHCAVFDVLSREHQARTREANETLVQTAKPILEKLGRAIADTHYFAILTNSEGVVVDVGGNIDRGDRRADLITRIGTDLSEQRIGTSAIGTALSEQQPVWLHRGEHFFANTADYSCAGAPVFGPDGACVGMLDLTGIEAVERPELMHLVTQVAWKISNALLLAKNHALMVRLNWPGNAMGGDADGIFCLDSDGWITGANQTARQMLPKLAEVAQLHVEDVFGMPYQMLFDAVRRTNSVVEVPLWTGLRLQAMPVGKGQSKDPQQAGQRSGPGAGFHAGVGAAVTAGTGLRDIETALIVKAVEQTKGNVAAAAAALGISRATVYRKLGKRG